MGTKVILFSKLNPNWKQGDPPEEKRIDVRLRGVTTPKENNDVTAKAYVDGLFSGSLKKVQFLEGSKQVSSSASTITQIQSKVISDPGLYFIMATITDNKDLSTASSANFLEGEINTATNFTNNVSIQTYSKTGASITTFFSKNITQSTTFYLNVRQNSSSNSTLYYKFYIFKIN